MLKAYNPEETISLEELYQQEGSPHHRWHPPLEPYWCGRCVAYVPTWHVHDSRREPPIDPNERWGRYVEE